MSCVKGFAVFPVTVLVAIYIDVDTFSDEEHAFELSYTHARTHARKTNLDLLLVGICMLNLIPVYSSPLPLQY